MRRLRIQVRHSKKSPTGASVQSLGVRFGWWPCLRGPFFSIDLGSRRLDIWWGLESYSKEAAS